MIARYLGAKASPAARLAMLRTARRGGSVSPEARAALARAEAAGACEVVGSAEVVGAEWRRAEGDDDDGGGDDDERGAGERVSRGGGWCLDLADGRVLEEGFDRLWLATGGAPGVRGSPLLSRLLDDVPIEVGASASSNGVSHQDCLP
jgi:hypothetical protein